MVMKMDDEEQKEQEQKEEQLQAEPPANEESPGTEEKAVEEGEEEADEGDDLQTPEEPVPVLISDLDAIKERFREKQAMVDDAKANGVFGRIEAMIIDIALLTEYCTNVSNCIGVKFDDFFKIFDLTLDTTPVGFLPTGFEIDDDVGGDDGDYEDNGAIDKIDPDDQQFIKR